MMKNFSGEANRSYDSSRIEYQLALELMGEKRFGKQVLDVGSGKGEFADILARKGYDVTCVEGKKELYMELKERGFKAVHLDLEEDRFPFPENSFDFVVSLEVIEHIWNTNHYLKEISRVIKPEGGAIFTTPNYNYWTFRLRAAIGQAERFLTQDYHKKLFTAHSLPIKLSQYFVVERIKGRGMFPKTNIFYSAPFLLNFFAMHIGIIARPRKQ